MSYEVLAFYMITPIDDPMELIKRHKEFFIDKDIKSRIYISHDGINSQMSASPEASKQYQEFLTSDPRFKDCDFKIHHHHEHPFPRQIVKYRKQLCAMDHPVDYSNRGEHISSQEWRTMLETKDEDTLVIDVRNRYESLVGYFEGSELPQVDTFREFVQYTNELKQKKDPKKTKVYMCCTGGIRCELYSAHMKEAGFDHVKQLQGGIIKYGMLEGNKHFKGKLYVFDDRMVVPISSDPVDVVSSCKFCNTGADQYFNCANMDCNNLFISCMDCALEQKCCCSPSCQASARVRPFKKEDGVKPFKKAHFYR